MRIKLILILAFFVPALSIMAQVENAAFNPQPFIDKAKKDNVPEWEIEKYIEIQKAVFFKKQPYDQANYPLGPGQACDNGNFEYGMLADWDCWTGTYGNAKQILQLNPGALIPLRHQITTGPSTDPYGNFPIVEPSGGFFSCKLGNDNTTSEAEVIVQIFTVSAATSILTYSFAIVLQDPAHPMYDQPYFRAGLYDSNNSPIPYSDYVVYAGAGIPNFNAFQTGWYLPWTSRHVDLSAYIGQDVTMRFETGDCAYGGHFGYAYVEANCGPLYKNSSASLCKNDSVELFGPANAASYLWSPGGQTTPSIYVSQTGQYHVNSTAANGYLNQPLLFNITFIDTSLWSNGAKLHSNQDSATYQWIDCSTLLPVAGATNQDFYPLTNGNYEVIITKDGCSDTSACTSKTTGISENGNKEASLTVYPNPAQGEFSIISSVAGDYFIVNVFGQTIAQVSLNAENNFSVRLKLSAGVYYLGSNNQALKQKIVVL
jgi:hypothetical protein